MARFAAVRAGQNASSMCAKADRIVSREYRDEGLMLTDRYGLFLSTTSSTAREAYVEGCAAKLTMYPGAIEAFDRAIAADPGFALAHAARAHALLERGEAAAARASMAAANALTAGLSAREKSHIAFFDLLVAGEADAALAALAAHLGAWPRDALVLGTTAFTNGLIGNSGRTGQKRALLDLLDRLAPSYGDDWWFTAHHGMAFSENGQRDAARPMIERSLAQNPRNPWAAHAQAHLCYEEGDPDAARAFLASWLPAYPRDAALYSHLSWHLALGHVEAGDAAAAFRLFRDAFAPDVHSGPPRGKINDAVSFLWRWELAGRPRDADAWHMMHEFVSRAFPHAGLAFSDMHVALAQVVAGNDAALAARSTEMDDLARNGRYPSGAMVPAVSQAFAAFERRDFPAAIDALEPIAGELERIGGSRAQLDLVEFTLLQAYVGADRLDDARRRLSGRHRGSSSIPVAGLGAVHRSAKQPPTPTG
jgi:Tfp pilus assembly protein PilF